MLTWSDVERVASRVSGLVLEGENPHAWRNSKFTVAWERPLSKKDMKALGEGAPVGEVLAVKTDSIETKFAWIETETGACFDSPHFIGYPAVLVDLDKVSEQVLFELLSEAAEVN